MLCFVKQHKQREMNHWLPQMDLHNYFLMPQPSGVGVLCVCHMLSNFCRAVSVSLSAFGALRWMRRSGLLSGLHSGLSCCLVSVRFSSELCDPHPHHNYTFMYHVGMFFRGGGGIDTSSVPPCCKNIFICNDFQMLKFKCKWIIWPHLGDLLGSGAWNWAKILANFNWPFSVCNNVYLKKKNCS